MEGHKQTHLHLIDRCVTHSRDCSRAPSRPSTLDSGRQSEGRLSKTGSVLCDVILRKNCKFDLPKHWPLTNQQA